MKTLEEIKQIREKRLSTLAEDYSRENSWVVGQVEKALVSGEHKVRIGDSFGAPENSHDYWKNYSPLKPFIHYLELDNHGCPWLIFKNKETVNYLMTKKDKLWEELTDGEKRTLLLNDPSKYSELKTEYEQGDK